MSYQPIENYGIIGNMRTAALIGKDGSLDWMCYPHFDSPSIFARLLDDEKGGYFSIQPAKEDYNTKQFYWPDTNVLITRFLSKDGVCEITDYMPVGRSRINEGIDRLVRRVKMIRGHIPMAVRCFPAFDYARREHDIVLSDCGAAFHSEEERIALATSAPLQQEENGVVAHLELDEGETANFVLREIARDRPCDYCFSEQEVYEGFRVTIDYWRDWISQCTYNGRWRETVYRSALTLKLLTFEPTGAIVAAPTASLPEEIGGVRNWDYRYTWIRDAAFTLYAFLRVGFTEEAARFMHFIKERCKERNSDGALQIMYGIDGRHELEETALDHLKGYRESRPVRTGNGAYPQLQLDIYGELLDSVYLYNKYGAQISYDFWLDLRDLINWVADNWQQKDEGIWEMRSGPQHFVYSRLMCWVALDRGLRLANKRSFPAERQKWLRERDRIYEEIMEKGWNEEMETFVQYYGSDALDASVLLMPLVFFLAPTDRRMLQTLDAINRSPERGGLVANGLVYRYNLGQTSDGVSGEEGTFNICTFWMVEAMTRAGTVEPDRLEEARLLFEQMLGHANHLGLYAEETGAHGEALGNFPQAFTHLSLISAAYNLNRALDK
jgi:GH15 family glucan-1,4-alpha-glucosidase